METRYLKTLLMAVETGSFSRAAEALHITQSAASQRIKFLEQHLGHRLLDRSGPYLQPTPVGMLVAEKIRSILATEQELLDELKRLAGEKRLTLCCTPTFGMAFLPRVLNRFLPQHADVADLKFLFAQPGQALKGLQENRYDLAVIEHFEDCDLSAFHHLPLPEDDLIFVSASGSGPDPGETPLEALLGHRLYARRDGCSSRQLLQYNLAALGHTLHDFGGVVVSDDLRLTLESVLAGDGISFVSRSLARPHLEEGTLQAHRVPGFTHRRRRSLIVPSRRREEDLLQNFIACVREVLEPAAAPQD